MPDPRYRVLAIATHPVQYMAPIFRRMATNPALDLQVAYCTLRGAEAGHDPNLAPTFNGTFLSSTVTPGPTSAIAAPAQNSSSASSITASGTSFAGEISMPSSFTGYRNATFWISCIAAKLSKTAFLFGTDTTTLAPRDGRAWKTAIKKILWPRLFRLADQVIVPSSGSRDLMLSRRTP